MSEASKTSIPPRTAEQEEAEDRDSCRKLAALSRDWKEGSELTDDELVEAILLVEQIAWEPNDRFSRADLEKGIKFNRAMYQVHLSTDPERLGDLTWGHVRGVSIVWPIRNEAYDQYLETNNYDWTKFGPGDFLPPDECYPSRSIYLQSVANVSVALANKSWFTESCSQNGNEHTGLHSLSSMLKHISLFVDDAGYNKQLNVLEPAAGNQIDELPRFIGDVRVDGGAIGNRALSDGGFLPGDTTTTKPDEWIKRRLDLNEYRRNPAPEGVRRFARAITEFARSR